jgi:hypothetical protein
MYDGGKFEGYQGKKPRAQWPLPSLMVLESKWTTRVFEDLRHPSYGRVHKVFHLQVEETYKPALCFFYNKKLDFSKKSIEQYLSICEGSVVNQIPYANENG